MTRLFVLVYLDQLIQCDIDDDILDKNNDLFILVSYINRVLCGMQSSQYFTYHICRKGTLNIFEEDLSIDCANCWMNDDDVLCKLMINLTELQTSFHKMLFLLDQKGGFLRCL